MSRLEKFSEIASILTVITGFLVLIGWTFNISILKSPDPGFQTIKSNVGLCFIFIGLSLWLMQPKRINPKNRRFAQILAFLAALIGFLTLLEYTFGWNLGIDQMLFKENPGALYTSAPNRMGFNAALDLTLAGIALLLLDLKIFRDLRPGQFLAIIGLFIAILALVGYGYGAVNLYYLPNYTGTAIYAAVTFILVFTGIISARSDKGLMMTLTSTDLGGILVRRLLPAIIIIPLISGWLLGVGENLGYYNREFSHALFAVSTVVFLTILLWFTAISINKLDHERKKLANDIRKNEEKFRTVADFTYNWEFWVDPEGNLLYVSPSCERISGYSPAEFLKNPNLLYEITHHQDREKLEKHRHEEMRNKQSINFEFRIINRDGEERWISHVCQPIYGDDGSFLGRRASHQDVTENKKAEEQIQKLANIVESSDDAITSKTLEGKITSWNRGAEFLYGYSSTEIIGKNISILVPDHLQKELEEYTEMIKNGKKVFHHETKRLRKDEIEIDVSLTLSPIFDTLRNMVGISTIARDITERRKAEEALRLSNIYNRNLIEASLDPLVTIGPDGKITDVNKATETVTGQKRDELIGNDFSNYFTQPEKAKKGYQQVFQKGFVRDYPLKIQHKNGTNIPVLYNASTYKNETGKVIGVFAAARDITQLKKAEEELKKHRENLEITVKKRTKELAESNEMLEKEIKEHEIAEKELGKVVDELTRSNKDLEQFAYIASHDLQEPLRSVSGFLQLLSRRYHGKLDSKADKYIDIAVGGATRMQTMIEDLLKFSRVTTRGKEFKPTDVETILGDVLLDLRAIIQDNNAIITHNPLPTIIADESQIKQLFQNLIANAIKFHGDEPPQIHVSSEEKNKEWLFSVKDNGIGIDPKYAERIFEVFKRLHTRKKYSGTGIGLAVSRKIVERHGGSIWIDSSPGEGSTFYFTISKEVSEL